MRLGQPPTIEADKPAHVTLTNPIIVSQDSGCSSTKTILQHSLLKMAFTEDQVTNLMDLLKIPADKQNFKGFPNAPDKYSINKR